MSDWTGQARRALAQGPTALVTILATEGSAPRGPGARMVVTRTGLAGSIGGGRLEHQATAQARSILGLEPGSWRVQDYPLGPLLGQCCGGRVRLLVEHLERVPEGEGPYRGHPLRAGRAEAAPRRRPGFSRGFRPGPRPSPGSGGGQRPAADRRRPISSSRSKATPSPSGSTAPAMSAGPSSPGRKGSRSISPGMTAGRTWPGLPGSSSAARTRWPPAPPRRPRPRRS